MEGVSIKILGRATLKLFGCVKPRANGGNIVGQQLPTLLDVTCCVRLYTLLPVVGCCCAKFETGQTFSYVQTDATTPNNVGSCLPTVFHPFAHGFITHAPLSRTWGRNAWRKPKNVCVRGYHACPPPPPPQINQMVGPVGVRLALKSISTI